MGEVRLFIQSDSDFVWSVKDFLAHLVGWDETNLKAASENLESNHRRLLEVALSDEEEHYEQLNQCVGTATSS